MPITLGPILEMLGKRQDKVLAEIVSESTTVPVAEITIPETGTVLITNSGTVVSDSGTMLPETGATVVPESSANLQCVLLYGGTFLLGFGVGLIACHYILKKKKTNK